MSKQDTPTEQFTVLVLRPDYAANNFGQDTFLAQVSAATIKAAQQAAQKEAAAADQESGWEDYAVLLVVRGTHYNLMVD